MDIDSLFKGVDLSCSSSRARYDALNMEYFNHVMGPVEKCMRGCEIDKSNVHAVALMGGSTHLPKVQEMIQDFFNGKEPSVSSDVSSADLASHDEMDYDVSSADLGASLDEIDYDVSSANLGASLDEMD